MFEAKQLQKQALECLRLQSDCMQLAEVAGSPKLQAHFVTMARFWETLAVAGPIPNVVRGAVKAKMQTT